MVVSQHGDRAPWLQDCSIALCGLRGFHLFRVFAEPRFAIAPRTVMEGRLRSTDVCCVAFPSFEDRSLQGASIGKAQLPRQVTDTIFLCPKAPCSVSAIFLRA